MINILNINGKFPHVYSEVQLINQQYYEALEDNKIVSIACIGISSFSEI